MRVKAVCGVVSILMGCFVVLRGQAAIGLQENVLIEPEFVTRYFLVNPIKPKYPDTDAQPTDQGEVLIFVKFDKDGKLVETKPLRSPSDKLSQAVIEALADCRIKPSVPSYLDSTYNSELRFIFSIKDGKGEVSDAPEAEQHKVSKEFRAEMKRRMEKN
jgi:hypothetical protein